MSASLASPDIFRFWGILYSPDLQNLSKPWKNIILLFWQVTFFSKMAIGKCRRVQPVLAKLLGECWRVWCVSQNCLVSVVSLGNQQKHLKKAILGNASDWKKLFFSASAVKPVYNGHTWDLKKVSVWKRCLTKLRFRLVIDETNWPLFTGGYYSQVVVKSGFTLLTFAKFAYKWP